MEEIAGREWNKIHRVLQTIVDRGKRERRALLSIGLRELLADSKAATV